MMFVIVSGTSDPSRRKQTVCQRRLSRLVPDPCKRTFTGTRYRRTHNALWAAGVLGLVLLIRSAEAREWRLSSPDEQVVLTIRLGEDPAGATSLSWRAGLTVDGALVTALPDAPLGIVREDQRFVENLSFVSASSVKDIEETYHLPHGKRSRYHYRANEQSFTFRNAADARVEIVARVFNDAVALRYRFPGPGEGAFRITDELTGFRLAAGGEAWMQGILPRPRHVNYERRYSRVTDFPGDARYAFPALYQMADKQAWLLITEAGLDQDDSGASLKGDPDSGVMRIHLDSPSQREGLPWTAPWRVVILGDSLADIVESSVVTHLAGPSRIDDTSWIRAGRASWSWWSIHPSARDFQVQEDYVDLAAEMGWEYTLVDALWPEMGNGGTIEDLIDYAGSNDVGVLLWYHQARDPMTSRQTREAEFKRIRDMGAVGIKVDFFKGDSQHMLRRYQDILEEAAAHRLMVNFHGSTLPRGWRRTWPNLMTMESVVGAEMYDFHAWFPPIAPAHNTIVAFTRNVVGPMDYTPVTFSDKKYPHLTTWGHELALAVVFESGWQHFADSPAMYRSLPTAAKAFLRHVPAAWDETRFIAGEPGRYAVLARRSGKAWYVGAINGEAADREISVPCTFLDPEIDYWVTEITDGPTGRDFVSRTGSARRDQSWRRSLRAYGGVVLRIVPEG